jgi:hypothetical protein
MISDNNMLSDNTNLSPDNMLSDNIFLLAYNKLYDKIMLSDKIMSCAAKYVNK